MADVSKLKAPDGTVLNIADLECRADLSAGFDYLSGQLALKANASDIPTVNNGKLTIQQNGTNVAEFKANAAGDVTANITVPDISTKVSKSGDTMTGNLSMKATNVDASKANNNVSSTQYPTTFNITDNANRIISRKECVVQSDGQIGSYWYTRNYNTSGGMVAQKGIRMMMNKSGALTWSVDDAASFRSAIGLYYEEQNGVSGCISSNNTTVDYIKCIRIGKIVTVTFSFVNSTAKTGELAWVALKPNFRPSGRIYFPCNIVGNSTAYTNESCHRMYIYPDGTMKMWIDNTNATVSSCMGSVSYCIN